MINQLAIFGATGDLSGRYLLPALAALQAAGELPGTFAVTCAGRQPWSTDEFRTWATERLDEHAAALPTDARRAVVAAASYRSVDISDPASVAAVVGGGPVAAYLALPPAVFGTVVEALRRAGLRPDSRIVLEKPFGEDLDSAIQLNRLLATVLPEQSVFRVDHFLAMTTVQNVLGSRVANRILEAVWNSTHIEEVEIVWEETLALAGRAGYYDGVGALKDMVQNHLLQLVCFVAMEPPLSFGERDLRDRKLDVLRAIRPLSEDDVSRCTRRARYTAGRVGDQEIPAYAAEEGVDPRRDTETFAELLLWIDNWRWSGTRFRLRTGKAFAADRKEVAVHFRSVPRLGTGAVQDAAPNVLRFGLEPEGMALHLAGVGPRPRTLVPLDLTTPAQAATLPAYALLLRDVLHGDPTLSIRGDEAEQAWRVVTPVLSAWEKDRSPLQEYPAGSGGPPRI